MKTLIALLVLTSSSAFAVCYNFAGRGPTRVGNIQLVAPATYVCLQKVQGFAGPAYTSFRLGDAEGDLLLAKVIGSSEGQLSLGYGNANGVNENFTGIYVSLQNNQLHIKTGRSFPETFNLIPTR